MNKHVCGLSGFGRGPDGLNDWCEACHGPRPTENETERDLDALRAEIENARLACSQAMFALGVAEKCIAAIAAAKEQSK